MRTPRHGRAAGLLLAALPLLLAGCGSESTDPDSATPPSASPTKSPEASMPTSPDDESPLTSSKQVREAVSDLAERQGVEEGDIDVVSSDEVTWRNGSLGCAQPGTMYTQALVDGRRIVLRVDGTDFEYHAGRGGTPFWCENPTE